MTDGLDPNALMDEAFHLLETASAKMQLARSGVVQVTESMLIGSAVVITDRAQEMVGHLLEIRGQKPLNLSDEAHVFRQTLLLPHRPHIHVVRHNLDTIEPTVYVQSPEGQILDKFPDEILWKTEGKDTILILDRNDVLTNYTVIVVDKVG